MSLLGGRLDWIGLDWTGLEVNLFSKSKFEELETFLNKRMKSFYDLIIL